MANRAVWLFKSANWLFALALTLALGATACGSEDSGSEEGGGQDVTGDTGTDAEGGGEGTDTGTDTEGGGAVCGDGTCNGTETCSSCPSDCGACPETCGDGVCNPSETCETCAQDCGACPASCGDGTCDDNETCETCAADCGACPSTCGDGTCDANEDCDSCPSDCGACPVCGDGTCDPNETCETCEDDCGACPPDDCGNNVCDANETCDSCPADCGACPTCGDGVCNGTETCDTCEADCGVCPACDLGTAAVPAAPAGAVCQLWGCTGDVINCPMKIARASQALLSPAALQFKAQYNNAMVTLVNFFDTVCFGEVCAEVNVFGPGAQPLSTGHSFFGLPDAPDKWVGEVNAILTNLADTKSLLSEAYLDASGNVVGDAVFAIARFELKSDIKKGDAVAFTIPFQAAPNNLVVTAPTLQELDVNVQNMTIVTGSVIK